jgi:hypothetical protein
MHGLLPLVQKNIHKQNRCCTVLLTETWLSDVVPNSLVFLDGYSIYRKDQNHKKRGGVCIYVSNELLSDNKVTPIVTNTPGLFAGV